MIDKRAQRRFASRIAGAMFGLLLVVGFVWFVRTMMAGKISKPNRQVQVVQIIRPPPPPPDQPPPPPPEKTEVPLPKDKPEPTPDEQQPPPEQPLGIDAQGTAGSDAFGLAARSGGSDLIGGTGTAPFAAKGSLSIHVFVEADGRVKQIKLATTTGDQKLDRCVDAALTSITRMNDPAPPGLPEQITMQIAFRT
jgi:protein TonB